VGPRAGSDAVEKRKNSIENLRKTIIDGGTSVNGYMKKLYFFIINK
jgi:hypothetical protein